MATSIELTIAGKVLSQPINDLYNTGKNIFVKELTKWKNSAAQEQLARRIAKIQRVKTFWQRDKEVSLYSFYYPSPIDFGDNIVKDIGGLSEFPLTGNFVIQGTVGQGKSIFMRHLCAQELKEKGSKRIPVFIELRHVKSDGLMPLVLDALDRLGFFVNGDLFDFYAKSARFILLLDGFDEISEDLVGSVTTEIERFCEKYERTQVLISSRPSNAIQNSRHFRIVKLSPLTAEDHPKFLKNIGLNTKEADKLIDAIKNSSAEVGGLLTTPLMLTLLVVVYRAENSIPADVPEFYERLFQTLFSKHDSIKPGLARRHRSNLGERKLQHLFEAFCFAVLQHKKSTTLTNLDFSRCYDAALKMSSIDCDEDAFKHDMTRAVCLLQEEGFDLHFVHKSVLEFFAASFIRGLNNEAAHSFYNQVSDSFWRIWSQVLDFLAQIDPYRYTTWYAIPNIIRVLKSLNVDMKSGEMLDAEESFFNVIGKLMVTHQQEGSFGVSKPGMPNKFQSNIDGKIFRKLFSGDYGSELIEKIGKKSSGNFVSEVSLEDFMHDGVPQVVISELKILVAELHGQLKICEAYVAKEATLTQMIKI